MNKKGFTLIELIAVVVIMSIIAIIATPNIINMMDKGKKEQYVADAKEFISKATYMYKQEKYKDEFETMDNGERISLNKVNGIKTEDKTDPYGFTYDSANSYIEFGEPDPNTSGVQERAVRITLISYRDTSCYTIESYKNKLSTNDVKEGIYSNGTCTTSTS